MEKIKIMQPIKSNPIKQVFQNQQLLQTYQESEINQEIQNPTMEENNINKALQLDLDFFLKYINNYINSGAKQGMLVYFEEKIENSTTEQKYIFLNQEQCHSLYKHNMLLNIKSDSIENNFDFLLPNYDFSTANISKSNLEDYLIQITILDPTIVNLKSSIIFDEKSIYIKNKEGQAIEIEQNNFIKNSTAIFSFNSLTENIESHNYSNLEIIKLKNKKATSVQLNFINQQINNCIFSRANQFNQETFIFNFDINNTVEQNLNFFTDHFLLKEEKFTLFLDLILNNEFLIEITPELQEQIYDFIGNQQILVETLMFEKNLETNTYKYKEEDLLNLTRKTNQVLVSSILQQINLDNLARYLLLFSGLKQNKQIVQYFLSYYLPFITQVDEKDRHHIADENQVIGELLNESIDMSIKIAYSTNKLFDTLTYNSISQQEINIDIPVLKMVNLQKIFNLLGCNINNLINLIQNEEIIEDKDKIINLLNVNFDLPAKDKILKAVLQLADANMINEILNENYNKPNIVHTIGQYLPFLKEKADFLTTILNNTELLKNIVVYNRNTLNFYSSFILKIIKEHQQTFIAIVLLNSELLNNPIYLLDNFIPWFYKKENFDLTIRNTIMTKLIEEDFLYLNILTSKISRAEMTPNIFKCKLINLTTEDRLKTILEKENFDFDENGIKALLILQTKFIKFLEVNNINIIFNKIVQANPTCIASLLKSTMSIYFILDTHELVENGRVNVTKINTDALFNNLEILNNHKIFDLLPTQELPSFLKLYYDLKEEYFTYYGKMLGYRTYQCEVSYKGLVNYFIFTNLERIEDPIKKAAIINNILAATKLLQNILLTEICNDYANFDNNILFRQYFLPNLNKQAIKNLLAANNFFIDTFLNPYLEENSRINQSNRANENNLLDENNLLTVKNILYINSILNKHNELSVGNLLNAHRIVRIINLLGADGLLNLNPNNILNANNRLNKDDRLNKNELDIYNLFTSNTLLNVANIIDCNNQYNKNIISSNLYTLFHLNEPFKTVILTKSILNNQSLLLTILIKEKNSPDYLLNKETNKSFFSFLSPEEIQKFTTESNQLLSRSERIFDSLLNRHRGLVMARMQQEPILGTYYNGIEQSPNALGLGIDNGFNLDF